MTDEQVEKLNALLAKVRSEMLDIADNAASLTGQAKSEFLTQEVKRVQRIGEDGLEQCILPHQIAVLKRELLGRRIHEEGIYGLLRSDDLFDIASLGISDDKIEEVKKETFVVHGQLRKDLADLHKEYITAVRKLEIAAWKRSLEPLTEEQRGKIQELVGPEFRIDSQRIR
ncbi:MAG: hypothetical protein KDB27_12855 [Planctomycetales bacterium]|nr:hypothetical protein [Planctomycetales bacterium]